MLWELNMLLYTWYHSLLFILRFSVETRQPVRRMAALVDLIIFIFIFIEKSLGNLS